MDRQKMRAPTKREINRRSAGILSRRDTIKFASTMKDSRGSEVLLALILIMEDLLSDESIGQKEWQAAWHYLTAQHRRVGFRQLIARIIAALGRGASNRHAARETLRRLLEIGYEMNPFDCESNEPDGLINALRAWVEGNSEPPPLVSEVFEGGMELRATHEIEPKKSGMTPLEIKFLVFERWGSITAAAREIGCSRSQLSYCISRKRISHETREKLARALGKTVEELFGELCSHKEEDRDS